MSLCGSAPTGKRDDQWEFFFAYLKPSILL